MVIGLGQSDTPLTPAAIEETKLDLLGGFREESKISPPATWPRPRSQPRSLFGLLVAALTRQLRQSGSSSERRRSNEPLKVVARVPARRHTNCGSQADEDARGNGAPAHADPGACAPSRPR